MQIDSTVRAESANSAPVPERKWKVLLTGQIGAIPNLSYGAMIGAVNKWGCYAKFRSNFKNPAADYECLRDGTTARGRISDASYASVSIDAGAVFHIRNFALSAGAGLIGFKVLELEAGLGILF